MQPKQPSGRNDKPQALDQPVQTGLDPIRLLSALRVAFGGDEATVIQLVDILRRHQCIVAGGSVLAAYGGFPIKDLDLYVHPTEARALLTGFYNWGYRLISAHAAPPYDQSFFRKNGILVRFRLTKHYQPPIDVMMVRADRPLRDVVRSFDLSFCQIWFDGRTVRAEHPSHIRRRAGFLGRDYLDSLFRDQNAFIIGRIAKYRDRGFTISVRPGDREMLRPEPIQPVRVQVNPRPRPFRDVFRSWSVDDDRIVLVASDTSRYREKTLSDYDAWIAYRLYRAILEKDYLALCVYPPSNFLPQALALFRDVFPTNWRQQFDLVFECLLYFHDPEPYLRAVKRLVPEFTLLPILDELRDDPRRRPGKKIRLLCVYADLSMDQDKERLFYLSLPELREKVSMLEMFSKIYPRSRMIVQQFIRGDIDRDVFLQKSTRLVRQNTKTSSSRFTNDEILSLVIQRFLTAGRFLQQQKQQRLQNTPLQQWLALLDAARQQSRRYRDRQRARQARPLRLAQDAPEAEVLATTVMDTALLQDRTVRQIVGQRHGGLVYFTRDLGDEGYTGAFVSYDGTGRVVYECRQPQIPWQAYLDLPEAEQFVLLSGGINLITPLVPLRDAVARGERVLFLTFVRLSGRLVSRDAIHPELNFSSRMHCKERDVLRVYRLTRSL